MIILVSEFIAHLIRVRSMIDALSLYEQEEQVLFQKHPTVRIEFRLKFVHDQISSWATFYHKIISDYSISQSELYLEPNFVFDPTMNCNEGEFCGFCLQSSSCKIENCPCRTNIRRLLTCQVCGSKIKSYIQTQYGKIFTCQFCKHQQTHLILA